MAESNNQLNSNHLDEETSVARMNELNVASFQNQGHSNEQNIVVLGSPIVKSAKKHSFNDESRYCWVCFATDEDDELAAWVQPCKCSGTTKWVRFQFKFICLQLLLHLY